MVIKLLLSFPLYRDLLPLVSALKYTQYFDGLKAKDYRLVIGWS